MSIRYHPNAAWIKKSHLARFISELGFKSYEEILKKSQEQTEWFWTEALKRTGLEFSKPYSKLLAAELPWPKWAEDGEISIAYNCIDRHLKKKPQHPAVIFESDSGKEAAKVWTYADLARESQWIADQLKNAGAKPGDRAALLMPMSLEMLASFFGILRTGLTVIPIFSGYGADAIASRLQDAQAKFVFIQEKTFRKGKEVNVRASLDEALKTSPSVQKIFSLKREDFFKGHPQNSPTSVNIPAEQEAMLLYTSGTTGKPKACVHTAFGILATTGKELYFGFDVHPEDRFFWYTDIGWMMGPWELLGCLQLGATIVLYEGVPDYPTSERLWEILEKHQVTHLGISPTAIRVLKKAGDEALKKYEFKNLRILGSTGEPWDEESWTWFFEKVGKSRCPIINISGGTEIMGCHLMPSVLSALKPCTLGGPALGVNAQVWSEEGESLQKGLGHLVCLSAFPSMTKGFLNSPQKYLETYFEKFGSKVWYHGDWAFIDDEGFWHLKGRSDDTIKIAGKRVGPNEFESALMEDPRVAEVAAVGLPHPIKGETVTCFVVLKNKSDENQKTSEELLKLASTKMGKALAPEKTIFVSQLPKTRSGKILRGLIRKILLKENFDPSACENTQSLEIFKQIAK